MAATTVRTVMTKDVVSVRALTTYKAIARILYENDISAVPVVDADHRVQGVVSEADLIEKQAQLVREHAEPRRPTGRRARRARTKARAASAAALMSGPAITVRPEANLATAAWLMSTHNVKRLPVVDADGRLIGIVSRGDLLAAILRSDGEIHDEVLNGVLLAEMCVDPHSIDVKVRDGVVTLSGRMENKFVARDTADRIRSLDGVVEVVNHLHPDPDEIQRDRLPFRTPVP